MCFLCVIKIVFMIFVFIVRNGIGCKDERVFWFSHFELMTDSARMNVCNKHITQTALSLFHV